MGFTDERHEVMLADGIERDIPDDDHLLVLLGELGLQYVLRGLLQSREDLLVHARDPSGGKAEPLPVGVLADALEDHPNRFFYLRSVSYTHLTLPTIYSV